MPPSKRSSSSSSRSVSSHSSSSHRSSGVSSHSSSSHSSYSVSSHSSSSHRNSGVSSHSSSSHRSSGVSSHSSVSHNDPNRTEYGVFSGKSYVNTSTRGGTRHWTYEDGYSYGKGSVREGSSLWKGGDKHLVMERYMRNQPAGYPKNRKTHPKPVQYHCVYHDYIYYPVDWVDKRTGIQHKNGYYDEKGDYHPNLFIKQSSAISSTDMNKKSFRICPYCDKKFQCSLKESIEGIVCPNCRGQIPARETDDFLKMVEIIEASPKQHSWRAFGIFSIVILATILIWQIRGIIPGKGNEKEKEKIEQTNDTIYVEEIGRTCKWLSYDEGYYDPETDCYFLYNDSLDNPVWQYWYEGISSDFGDYGWMEYNEMKEAWFIEESDGNWIELPDKYSTDNLWHIK